MRELLFARGKGEHWRHKWGFLLHLPTHIFQFRKGISCQWNLAVVVHPKSSNLCAFVRLFSACRECCSHIGQQILFGQILPILRSSNETLLLLLLLHQEVLRGAWWSFGQPLSMVAVPHSQPSSVPAAWPWSLTISRVRFLSVPLGRGLLLS